MELQLDLNDFIPLDPAFAFELSEMLAWPLLLVERYALYECTVRVRALLSQQERNEAIQARRAPPPLAHQLITIGANRAALRDLNDLTSDIRNSGGRAVFENIINQVPEHIERDPLLIPLSTLSRTNGLTITAVSKLHEIVLRLDIPSRLPYIRHETWAMCLADGEGGFTNYLLGLSPHINVIFNSLFELNPSAHVIPDCPGEVRLSGQPFKISRCYARHNYSGANDLGMQETVHSLVLQVTSKTSGAGVSLITFDAEGKDLENEDVYFTMFRNVLILCLKTLSHNGTAILKHFIHRSERL